MPPVAASCNESNGDGAGAGVSRCVLTLLGPEVGMLRAAGLGVGFHSRSILRARVDQIIEHFGLDGILYLLGLDNRDIDGT